MFNSLFTQIVIISWYSLGLIYPSIIFHSMKEQYVTTKEQILISSRGQLSCLTGIRNYVLIMWTNKFFFFNETLMNILQKIVPNETIVCDDREPLWINETLLHINQFKAILDKLGFLIEKSKNNYYSKLSQKLSIKATSPKAY